MRKEAGSPRLPIREIFPANNLAIDLSPGQARKLLGFPNAKNMLQPFTNDEEGIHVPVNSLLGILSSSPSAIFLFNEAVTEELHQYGSPHITFDNYLEQLQHYDNPSHYGHHHMEMVIEKRELVRQSIEQHLAVRILAEKLAEKGYPLLPIAVEVPSDGELEQYYYLAIPAL